MTSDLALSRAAAVLSAMLLVAPATVHARTRAVAKAAEEASSSRVVAVEVAGTIDRGDQLADALRGESESVLREHELPTEINPAKPRKLTVKVSGEKFAYRVALAVERDGTAGETHEISCECTQDELIAKVRTGVEAQVSELGDGPPADPGTPNGAVAPPTDPPITDERKPLGGLGKGGIAALVIGTVALGTGIGLAVVGKRERAGDSERAVETTNFGPPGYALIGIGAAAMITGVVLIAIDRKRARPRATSFTPWVGPRFAGLSFGRRF